MATKYREAIPIYIKESINLNKFAALNMSGKFQNKYRISSARLQNWDYGSNAMYFVTICTHNREYYFGEIMDGKMHCNEIGQLANQYWNEIPNHFSFVELGEFVVMPNHIHGILIFNKINDAQLADGVVETPNLGVSTATTTAPALEKWKPQTLGVVINQYKRICTIHARKIHADFAWQSRYHDHIIRNNESFQRISNYIKNNPANWQEDKFHNNT